jgi:hypothetical protein
MGGKCSKRKKGGGKVLEWPGVTRRDGYSCMNVLCFCCSSLVPLAKVTLLYIGLWGEGVETLELLVTLYS